MASLRTLAALAAVLLLASPVLAQPGPDEVGAYFNDAGTISAQNVSPFVPFTFYVVANPASDIEVFGLSISVPADVIILTVIPPAPCPVCGPDDPFPLGVCHPAGPLRLLEVQAMSISPSLADGLLCVGPGGLDFQPPAPGYKDCGGQLVPLSGAPVGSSYPDGCAVLNPVGVATATATWGHVKSRF